MTREEYLKRKIYLKKQAVELINDEIKLLRTELKQTQGAGTKKAVPSDPPVTELPVVGGESYPVSRADLAEWMEAYPGVSIIQELKSMVQWCKSNPKKQKTKRGARKFITGWLSRAQDKPKPHISPNEPIDNRPMVFPTA